MARPPAGDKNMPLDDSAGEIEVVDELAYALDEFRERWDAGDGNLGHNCSWSSSETRNWRLVQREEN